jgi:uncharacterized membrane protein
MTGVATPRMLWAMRLGLLALLALQVAWHGLLPPPRSPLGWTALAVAVLPLLAVLPGAWQARPAPLFWANILALLYFCHGVSEAWTTPELRLLALVEAALAAAIVCAYGAFGLASRRALRAAEAAAGAGHGAGAPTPDTGSAAASR